MLLEDALAGLELVRRVGGPIVDVGSGGGTPGIPLAALLPEREVTLLEAERRKTKFLERWTGELPNLRVLWVGPSADASAVASVAGKIAGELEESRPGFFVIRKTGPTPPGVPRRPGVAKKRPLA